MSETSKIRQKDISPVIETPQETITRLYERIKYLEGRLDEANYLLLETLRRNRE